MPPDVDADAPLSDLLGRVAAGDEAARAEFGDHLHRRLKRLCRLKLARDFPFVAAHHELDSAVHTAWIDVMTMLRAAPVENVPHFLKWIGSKVRFVLLDMAIGLRTQFSREGQFAAGDSSAPGFEPEQSTFDPVKLAQWGEFHAAVATLPEDEREIVELHYLCDLSQADIARQFDRHPRAVARTWEKAKAKLVKYL